MDGSNRIQLDHLFTATVEDAAHMAADEIAMLLDDVKALENKAKSCKAFLNLVVQFKYGLDKNTTGTQRVHDDGYDVVVNVPKKVVWDQEKLDALYTEIAGNDADPSEYIDVKYSVAEKKYDAWPESIRVSFTPARTVMPGSPTVKFERKEGK